MRFCTPARSGPESPEIEDAETRPHQRRSAARAAVTARLVPGVGVSNHVSGKLIHVDDDWKRFEHQNMRPELYTLRRVQKI